MSDPHRRLAAALEGRYLIERELGEGGMATVFLARDLKHNRPVALKVLKPELAAVVGAERFLAEIETTANLQHPHILPLFDSGEADGFLFYVMPFVEGETLADRLARERQLPVDEAVSIARAVAEALETAHEAGVIHRDVKPGNILLSRGQPLVSDFGIALAVGAGGARLTETGLSVGTPYYMSPEQATGDQPVGPGADVYALGCVLYEMLVGEPPYVGNTAQAVLGKIIQGLPVSPTAVRKTVPAHVDAAIRKALERLPADRFTRAADFARALGDPGFRHGERGGVAAGPSGSGWRGWAWPAVAVLAAAAAVVGWMQRPAATDDGPVERFRIEIPGYIPNSPMSFGAVAPDGSAFAFLGWDEDRRLRVFLKDAGDLDATAVDGLQPDDVGALAFSPDGNWLAVASFDGRLLKVARSGGGVSEQAEVEANVVVWPEDGAIAVGDAGRIVRVAVDGGVLDTIPLSAPEAEVRQMTPLPDDRGFLFVQVPADAAPELWAFDARAGETRLVREGVVGAWYGDPGILVLAESGPGRALEISAVGFDLGSLQVAGVPVGIGEAVASFVGSPEMWLSPGGTLVYAPRGRSVGRSELVWVDRSGAAQSVDPEVRFGFLSNGGQRLSPDGSRVALARYLQDGESEPRWDIVVQRLPDFPPTSVAAVDGPKRRPAWHPDGTALVYIGRGGSSYLDLWETRADGTGTPTRIFGEERAIFEGLWSPDGEWVVYRTDDETEVEGRGDIMGFRPGVDTVAIPLIATPAEETSPAISPDGRWIAYASSDQSGTKNIFVRPFPDVDDGVWQISSTGGTEPAWSGNGTEIFFWSSPGPGGEMRVARIDTVGGFALESVETLFPTPAGILKDDDNRLYDVHPDGERFLMVRTVTPPDDGLVYVSDFFQVAREALGG